MARWSIALGDTLREMMAEAPMPAVGVSVETPLGTAFREVTGTANLRTGERVTPNHWWDLASLTKVFLTTTELLDVVSQNEAAFDSELAEILPAAASTPLGHAPLSSLLSHGTGLPGDRHLYREQHPDHASMIAAVLQTPSVSDLAVYSDLNFILLGEALTSITGNSLTELAARRGFCATLEGLPQGPHSGYVATEECRWRRRMIQGEVHDENAAALGGLAGHAGAFATVAMAGDAARAWLTGDCLPDGAREVAARHWSRNASEQFGFGLFLGSTRGLGGLHPGPGAFGASGFVGNRLWVEPARGYAILILSNRVHPYRSDREPFDRWSGELLNLVGRAFTET